MDKAQFLEKAKAAGFSEADIRDAVKLHEEAEKDGVKVPYELFLENRVGALVY